MTMNLPPPPTDSDMTILALKDEIANLRNLYQQLSAKCEKCPFAIADAKNKETTKQIIIIGLSILGAVLGYKVIP